MLLLAACGSGNQTADTPTPETKVVARPTALAATQATGVAPTPLPTAAPTREAKVAAKAIAQPPPTNEPPKPEPTRPPTSTSVSPTITPTQVASGDTPTPEAKVEAEFSPTATVSDTSKSSISAVDTSGANWNPLSAAENYRRNSPPDIQVITIDYHKP